MVRGVGGEGVEEVDGERRYTIQGCETQASTFAERVATIKNTIEGVHDIPAVSSGGSSCYWGDGL